MLSSHQFMSCCLCGREWSLIVLFLAAPSYIRGAHELRVVSYSFLPSAKHNKLSFPSSLTPFLYQLIHLFCLLRSEANGVVELWVWLGLSWRQTYNQQRRLIKDWKSLNGGGSTTIPSNSTQPIHQINFINHSINLLAFVGFVDSIVDLLTWYYNSK